MKTNGKVMPLRRVANQATTIEPDLAKLASLIAAYAPHDGSFELCDRFASHSNFTHKPGVCACPAVSFIVHRRTRSMDAGTASQRVGYLSPSQFSREYSAFSGARRQGTSPDCVMRLGFGSDPRRSEVI